MKAKIAYFGLTGTATKILFDHEPCTAGWFRVSEWAEVELPDRTAEDIGVERELARIGELNELKLKIAKLEAT